MLVTKRIIRPIQNDETFLIEVITIKYRSKKLIAKTFYWRFFWKILLMIFNVIKCVLKAKWKWIIIWKRILVFGFAKENDIDVSLFKIQVSVWKSLIQKLHQNEIEKESEKNELELFMFSAFFLRRRRKNFSMYFWVKWTYLCFMDLRRLKHTLKSFAIFRSKSIKKFHHNVMRVRGVELSNDFMCESKVENVVYELLSPKILSIFEIF